MAAIKFTWLFNLQPIRQPSAPRISTDVSKLLNTPSTPYFHLEETRNAGRHVERNWVAHIIAIDRDENRLVRSSQTQNYLDWPNYSMWHCDLVPNGIQVLQELVHLGTHLYSVSVMIAYRQMWIFTVLGLLAISDRSTTPTEVLHKGTVMIYRLLTNWERVMGLLHDYVPAYQFAIILYWQVTTGYQLAQLGTVS